MNQHVIQPIWKIAVSFNFVHFYCIFTEPSSRGSDSSEDSADILHTVRSLPLGRGEELVVDEFKNSVLARANYANKAVRPFKNRLGTRFVEYHILELQEPPYGIVYVPKIVDPEQWALDIYQFGVAYNVGTL